MIISNAKPIPWSLYTTRFAWRVIPKRCTHKKSNNEGAQSDSSKKGDTDNTESALRQRFEQLAEDSTPIRDDPLTQFSDSIPIAYPIHLSPREKAEHGSKLRSLMDSEKILQQIEARNSPASSDHDSQHASLVQRHIKTKIPSYAPPSARDLATAKPWAGSEAPREISQRLSVDKYSSKVSTFANKNTPKLMTPPVPLKERILSAKEKTLDYRLDKISGISEKEKEKDDGFREMYRERLLGPELLGPSSFSSTINSIKAISDRRVEESKLRGEFDNLPNRGKPLKLNSVSNVYIDTTEYHLNDMLKRQDITLPWIEKQGGVTKEIEDFKMNLESEVMKKLIFKVEDMLPKSSFMEKMEKIREYQRAESLDDDSKKLRDKKWESVNAEYLNIQLRHLNDSIRAYNLQTPLSLQKFYLLPEKELAQSYTRCVARLDEAFNEFYERNRNPLPQIDVKQSKVHSKIVPAGKGVSISMMIKELFTKN